MLWAVAGCLFEVHLPRTPDGEHWWWTGETPVVTLLVAHPSDEPPDWCRLRFRAEQPGEAVLVFASEGGRAETVLVRIAPERVVDG